MGQGCLDLKSGLLTLMPIDKRKMNVEKMNKKPVTILGFRFKKTIHLINEFFPVCAILRAVIIDTFSDKIPNMSSIGTGYDLSASQFSPDGRVFQVTSIHAFFNI